MLPDTTEDARDLAAFGYRQTLDRTLGGFSSFAAGFSYISILTGVFQLFYVGYAAGGPAFFWTWPAVFLGQLTVALVFAELAARYPLSGAVYQWSRAIGSPGVGWVAGWIYLACSIVGLASVALAVQATLPQMFPAFQFIGDGSSKSDTAKNAVLLGCGLIAVSTWINARGVTLMARINNVGVIAELLGVTLLIGLLAANIRRGPAILLDTHGYGQGQPLGYLGPFLAAALMSSYVLYGFETAGALAEETDAPRRRAPWAIIQALVAAGVAGSLVITLGIMAVPDPGDPNLGTIAGGLPSIVKQALGPRLGYLLLAEVIFAVFVCALAVHASSVRLVFAMARDNNLPFAHALARVGLRTHTPVLPALLTGLLASILLLANINFPNCIETLCSLAIVWANLAYLFVTVPRLISRLTPGQERLPIHANPANPAGLFSLGRFGLPINLIAVVWGLFVIINIGWPRAEVYGTHPIGRYSALLATLALLASGFGFFVLFQRDKAGILSEHVAPRTEESGSNCTDPVAPASTWIRQLAPGD